ncbi:MAG: hypothetical protein KatS3mg111_4067 [Pirellulaceae bacterium]|nr:MAG: hypothetical protein KatS3mg111_4067 [Pirellulaceae bacterium]
MAQNLAPRSWHQRWSSLAVNRCCVVLVAGLSLAIAYAGQDAYELLESAYSLTLVGLLVPFLGGIWSRRGTSGAALASLGLGVTLWVTAEQFGLSDHGTLRLGRWSFPWPGVIGIVGVTAVLYAFLSSLPSLFHDERRRLRSTSSDHPPEGQEA